jgi:outer membrane biosynthesis protein TonB
MRQFRLVLTMAALVMVAPVLAACENFDMDNLDIFHLNDKKKLPGERRPVFPEGVPGVSQGVPPDLVKGYQPPPQAAQPDAAAEEAKEAAEAEKPKPKAKVRKPAPAQPAAQSQPAPQQQQQSGANAPWPASPAPGTFQR